MPVGFYNSYNSNNPKAYQINQTNQMLGIKDTPFYSSLGAISPDTSGKGTPSRGFEWEYDIIPEHSTANKHLEGGEAANAEYHIGKKGSNHFQIVKNSYGVSKSSKNDSREGLTKQKTYAMIKQRKDINHLLLNNAQAVARTATVAGETMGLAGVFSTDNTIDAKGASLSYKLIEDALELTAKKGINMNTAFIGALQKRTLNGLLRDVERGVVGESNLIGHNYHKITNLQNTTSEIDIKLERMCKDNELIFCDMSLLKLVLWREEERELPTTKDALLYEIVTEFGLFWANPMAAVKITNLKTN